MKRFFKNRTIVGLISIILSLVICFLVAPLFNNAVRSKTEIVRVTKDILKGEVITASNIETVEIGGYNLPRSVVKNKKTVIGKYVTADLFKGDYILDTKLSVEKANEDEYLYDLDGRKEAISVTIKSFAAGLSGKLNSGDVVSIIASNYGEAKETLIPNELQFVKILAVTTSKGTDKTYSEKAKKDDDKSKELPSTVTVLVNKVQARLLADLEENSKLHISLVYRGNEKNTKKFLEEQEKIISEANVSTAINNNTNIKSQGAK